MLRNYFAINLLLLLVLGVLGYRLYMLSSYAHVIPTEANVKQSMQPDSSTRGRDRRDRQVDYTSFDKIKELDLFRSTRKAPAESVKKEETAPMKDPPKLFGTIILNDSKSAIMEEPESKVTKMFRLNDLIAGYTVSDILENKVVLTRGDEKVEVRLREDKGIKPVALPQVKTPPRSPRQVTSPRAPVRRRTRPVPPRRRPTRVRPPATAPAPER